MMILLSSADPDVIHRWKQAAQTTGTVHSAKSLQDMEQRLPHPVPTVCLVDSQLPGFGSVGDLRRLIVDNPGTAFMYLPIVPQEAEGLAVFRLGGRGYCNRFMAPELLRQAINVVAAGEVWVGQRLLNHLIGQLVASDKQATSGSLLAPLTAREREIARLVANGLSNRAVAEDLAITERTVKAHLNSVFRKTGTDSRLQLALLIKGQGGLRGPRELAG